MEIIEPITLSKDKEKELILFFKKIPNCTIYLLNNLLDVKYIDNKRLSNSIINYFLKNLEENQDIDNIMYRTSGLCYKYQNKIYLFCNNLEDTLFHEMAHAIYSDKIKEIIKSKHKKLRITHFNILDEFNAQYWETKKTLNPLRLEIAKVDVRFRKIKFYSEIHYNCGCFIALSESDSCGDISMFPKSFIDLAINLKKCFIYNNEQLIDIDLDLFKSILKTSKH